MLLDYHFTYMYTGEAKERPLSRTKDVHAMSREVHKESKEALPVEEKGNTSLNLNGMLRVVGSGNSVYTD